MAYEKFITVSELIHQLNLIDGSEQTSVLDNLILAASDVVNEYVQGNVRPEPTDAEPNPGVYPRVKQATAMLAAEWYENRETQATGLSGYGHGFLPQAIQSILYPLRTPVVL